MHSGIVTDKRPVVIVHDTPDEIVLPDKQDEAAFNDVYIVKGDPANEVILRRAKVAQAHSVVILSDDRQEQHADGKTIVCCIAVKNACVQDRQPNIVAECQHPKYQPHMSKAGADEVISAADFGLRLDGTGLALSWHDAAFIKSYYRSGTTPLRCTWYRCLPNLSGWISSQRQKCSYPIAR